MSHRWSRRVLLALSVGIASACGDAAPEAGDATLAPPPIDALLVTPDSLFWLWADSTGLRIRGVAMTVAFVDSAFHELYRGEDDRSFYDAIFYSESLYRRNLESGDSLRLFADTLIPRLAAAYAAAHPRERPLRPDEPANEHARTVASVELRDLQVFGPYANMEYAAEIDVIGGTSVRETRRMMLDLRTGAEVGISALFDRATAGQLLRTARADLAAAGEAGAWRLDERSFGLEGSADTVLVTFEAVATDPSYGEVTLSLTPIAVPAPDWWAALGDERPADNEALRYFTHRGMQLAFGVTTADGKSTVILLDEARRSWDVGRVGGGRLRQVYWLDSTLSAPARAALRRAFDDAAMYSGEARVVRGPVAPRRGGSFSLVAWSPSPRPPR